MTNQYSTNNNKIILFIYLIFQSFINGLNHEEINCGKFTIETSFRCSTNKNHTSDFPPPWHVKIYNDDVGKHWCSGTLISDIHVLTSAHCFDSNSCSSKDNLCDPGKFKIILGSPTHQIYKRIFNVAIYTDWKIEEMESSGKDIAVITLSSSVKFDVDVASICLPLKKEMYDSLFKRSGYGVYALVSDGNISRLFLKSNSYCQDQLMKSGKLKLSQNYICATTSIGCQNNLCPGDSGGSLVAQKRKRWYIGGILSFGIDCKDTKYPNYFIGIYQHLSWINKVVDKSRQILLMKSNNRSKRSQTYNYNQTGLFDVNWVY